MNITASSDEADSTLKIKADSRFTHSVCVCRSSADILNVNSSRSLSDVKSECCFLLFYTSLSLSLSECNRKSTAAQFSRTQTKAGREGGAELNMTRHIHQLWRRRDVENMTGENFNHMSSYRCSHKSVIYGIVCSLNVTIYSYHYSQ